MQAEDADVLILLIHHSASIIHPSTLLNHVNLSLKDRGASWCFVMPALVVIQFLQLGAMGKPLFLTGFVQVSTCMDIFLDVQATKDVMIKESIFQYI